MPNNYSVKCKQQSKVNNCSLAKPGGICSFCKEGDRNELTYGKFYQIGCRSCHHFCLLLSSKLLQNGRDNEGILGFLSEDIDREIKRVSKAKCYYCGWCGASLTCNYPNCNKKFHLPCGRRNGALNMFSDQYQSFCKGHRPMQKVPANIFLNRSINSIERLIIPLRRVDQHSDDNDKSAVCKVKDDLSPSTSSSEYSDSPYLCAICYDDIIPYPTVQSMWPECCKKDTWLHRICLEKYALSAGKYHIRCPLCTNQPIFLNMLLRFGIFVPDQDASWELEDGAFQELLERPKECFREDCLCPKGKEYNATKNGPWKLIICSLCGSQAIHKDCDESKGRKSVICNRCLPSPVRENPEPDVSDNLSTNDSDDEILSLDCGPEDNEKSDQSVDNETSSNTVVPHYSLLSKVETVQTRSLIKRLTKTLSEFKNINHTSSIHSVDIPECQNSEISMQENIAEPLEKCEESMIKIVNVKNMRKNKKSIKKQKKCEGSEKNSKMLDSKEYNGKKESKALNNNLEKSENDSIQCKDRESLGEPNIKKNHKSKVGKNKKVVSVGGLEKIEKFNKIKTGDKCEEMKPNLESCKSTHNTIQQSKSNVCESSANSTTVWCVGKPCEGVNVVLKNGKFCVLFKDGVECKVNKLFAKDGDKEKRKCKEKKERKYRQKSEKISHGDVGQTKNVSVCSKKEMASKNFIVKKLSSTPIVKSSKKNKLSPDKGQINITSFFKKIDSPQDIKAIVKPEDSIKKDEILNKNVFNDCDKFAKINSKSLLHAEDFTTQNLMKCEPKVPNRKRKRSSTCKNGLVLKSSDKYGKRSKNDTVKCKKVDVNYPRTNECSSIEISDSDLECDLSDDTKIKSVVSLMEKDVIDEKKDNTKSNRQYEHLGNYLKKNKKKCKKDKKEKKCNKFNDMTNNESGKVSNRKKKKRCKEYSDRNKNSNVQHNNILTDKTEMINIISFENALKDFKSMINKNDDSKLKTHKHKKKYAENNRIDCIKLKLRAKPNKLSFFSETIHLGEN